MKIIKTALNKTRISMSRDEWIQVGQAKGWLEKSAFDKKKYEDTKEIDFRVYIDEEKSEGLEVFWDDYFELGTIIPTSQSKIVYDLLNNKAQSQEGKMTIIVKGEETRVKDFGEESSQNFKTEVSTVYLEYIDRITQAPIDIELPRIFSTYVEQALGNYLRELDYDFEDKFEEINEEKLEDSRLENRFKIEKD